MMLVIGSPESRFLCKHYLFVFMPSLMLLPLNTQINSLFGTLPLCLSLFLHHLPPSLSLSLSFCPSLFLVLPPSVSLSFSVSASVCLYTYRKRFRPPPFVGLHHVMLFYLSKAPHPHSYNTPIQTHNTGTVIPSYFSSIRIERAHCWQEGNCMSSAKGLVLSYTS